MGDAFIKDQEKIDAADFTRPRIWRIVLVRKALVLIALASMAAGCLPPSKPAHMVRGEQAEVQIYLQPLPQESRRLQWAVDSLALVRNDRSKTPLLLHVPVIVGHEISGKQRLLASGVVAPGTYAGISITIKDASVTRQDGDAALAIPVNPVFIEQPLDLNGSGILPMFLSLEPTGLVTDGFSFTPSFSLSLPSDELTSLTGYLVLPQSDRITVFNRKTLHTVGAVATGRAPLGIAIDAGRGRAYVAVSKDDTIQVVDVLRGSDVEQINIRTGDEPRDLALTPDGQTLLSANYASDTVSIIDAIQGVEIERIKVGQGPTSVIVNRSGSRAYITCALSSTLEVIDLSSGLLSARLSLDSSTPRAVALDRDERKIFAVSGDSPNLTVVDTAALMITDRIYVGMGSVSIDVDEKSGLVYVGRAMGREILVVDPSVLMPIDTIRVGGAVRDLTIDSQENALLVVLDEPKVLQKIDLISKGVLAQLDIDTIASEVAVFENR